MEENWEELLSEVDKLNSKIDKVNKDSQENEIKKKMLVKQMVDGCKKYEEETGVKLSGKDDAETFENVKSEYNRQMNLIKDKTEEYRGIIEDIQNGNIKEARKKLGLGNIEVVEVEDAEDQVVLEKLEEDESLKPEIDLDSDATDEVIDYEDDDEQEMEFDEIEDGWEEVEEDEDDLYEAPTVDLSDFEDDDDWYDDEEEVSEDDADFSFKSILGASKGKVE